MPTNLLKHAGCRREMTNLYKSLVHRLERKSEAEGLGLIFV